nr:hypothetical protein [Tanacetum cinerariifolium]
DFCKEYYEDILPIIMDKVRCDKRKEVYARLDFGEGSRKRRIKEDSHHSSARARTTSPKRLKVRDRLRYGDQHVLDRLGWRLLMKVVLRIGNASVALGSRMMTLTPTPITTETAPAI